MTFPRFIAIIGLLMSGIGAAASPARGSADRPNILWIGVDQMRADTPGCNGNTICTTPHLDRLAAEGVNFTRAYTNCCLCSPARASMLTGRFAFKHGMGTNCDLYHALARELPHPEMLLHHRLQKMGYRCGFAGKWHVGTEKSAVDYGFEGMDLAGYGDIRNDAGYRAYLKKAGLTYGPLNEPIYGNPNDKTLLAGRWNGPLESNPTYYVAEFAIDLLNRFAEEGRPFFLNCQFWAPHPPHVPAGAFTGMHDRTLIQPWVNFEDDYAGKPARVKRFRRDFYQALPTDWNGWREIVGLYYDSTAMMDAQVGRLLRRLDELGLKDDTIVIFESDHGDMTGSHGGLFDKGFMYEESFRIPMIMAWPGRFEGGRRCEGLVYHMDIFPTLLDILGQPDPTLDGMSLLPWLEDRASAEPREAIYLEFHGLRALYTQRALVTREGYKYIFNAGDFDEFYDLNADPGELHNLIDSAAYAERVAEVRRQIKAAAARAADPVADYLAKLFGDWEHLSGQFEAAAPIRGQTQAP